MQYAPTGESRSFFNSLHRASDTKPHLQVTRLEDQLFMTRSVAKSRAAQSRPSQMHTVVFAPKVELGLGQSMVFSCDA